jgi:molybdopterin-guanine dinucleotide biosynthesis protein A
MEEDVFEKYNYSFDMFMNLNSKEDLELYIGKQF